MIGNKWNYPIRSNESNRHQVDLALAPPHYSQLSQRNKSKSNPFSLADITKVVKSVDYRDSQLYKTDSNHRHQMVKDNESLKNAVYRPQSIDMPSLVSMEILESQGISSKNEDQKDVTLRVAEMNRILKEAEKYLNNCKIDTPSAKEDKTFAFENIPTNSDQRNNIKSKMLPILN